MKITAKDDEAGKYEKAHETLNQVMEETGKVIVGQEEVLENILISILCDGNVLLESYPGLGKTKMVHTLSEVLGLDFSRIQNTPDLMPSDITGTHIINEEGDEKDFIFQKGPIFANMILADEINRATPKCVTADTEIFTADGELREAEEIFSQEAGELVKTDGTEEWWNPNETLEVPSFNPETGEIEKKNVSYIYRQQTDKPTYEIRLASGREIEVSETHPFFTIKEGNIETKKAKEIEEEDCVLLPGQVDIHSSKNLEYDQEAIKKSDEIKLEIERRKHLYRKFEDGMKPSDTGSDQNLIKTFQKTTPDYIQREIRDSTFVSEAEQFGQIFPLEMPEKVTEELAHFTALTVAEGYTSKDRGVQIDMKSTDLVEYSAEIIEQLFSYEVEVHDSDGDKKRIVAGSSTFSDLLEAMGFKIEANSGEKEIPEFMMKAPKEQASEFLKMFFEAEGTVKREHVKFTTKSEKMINQLSYLLLRFGVNSRLNKVKRSFNGRKEDYWELRFYGENIQKFRQEIGFFGDRKNEQLEELAEKCRDGKFMDLVPEMHSEIRRIRKENGLTHEEFHELTGLYSHNLENPNNRQRHSKRKLKTINKNLKQEGHETGSMEVIAEGEFTTDFVESVERKEGRKVLYDLTVKENHSFIAGKGGIIVHNTQSALLEAMQEKQVTAGNQSYQLDKPFFLMATQNPIDQEGTYPLPEAQSDRFMMKLTLDYPEQEEEEEIVDRFTSELDFSPELENVLSKPSLIKLQEFTRQVPIADDIRERAVEIVKATRDHEDLNYGASPRASMALVLGGKARALMEGRNYVSASDINSMAKPVMRHRIGLNFKAEKEGKEADGVIEEIVNGT